MSENDEMLIPYLVCKTGMVVFEHTGLGNMLGFPDSGAQGSGCIGLDFRVLGWGSWIRENKQLPPGLHHVRILVFCSTNLKAQNCLKAFYPTVFQPNGLQI